MMAAVRESAKDYPGMADDPHFRAVLAAMAGIDRALFVPEDEKGGAYRTMSLPIGYEQTISNPIIVAIMTASVGSGRGSRVLEIGTGSGYQAALLSRLGARVHSIEVVAPLARRARTTLHNLGFANIRIRAGDGAEGWSEFAPYDQIVVTAGAIEAPTPLLAQLKAGGKMVMPIGPRAALEQLVVFTKNTDGRITRCSLGPAMFVPLTGKAWKAPLAALYDRTIPLCYPGQTARWPGQ